MIASNYFDRNPLERLPYKSQEAHHKDVIQFVRDRHHRQEHNFQGHNVRVGIVDLHDRTFVDEFVEALRGLHLEFLAFETQSPKPDYGLIKIAQVLPSTRVKHIRVKLHTHVCESAFEEFLRTLDDAELGSMEIHGQFDHEHLVLVADYIRRAPWLTALHISGAYACSKAFEVLSDRVPASRLRTLDVFFDRGFVKEADVLGMVRAMEHCPRVANLCLHSEEHDITPLTVEKVERLMPRNSLVRVFLPGPSNWIIDHVKETDWYEAAIIMLAVKCIARFKKQGGISILSVDLIRCVLEAFHSPRVRVFS
jgi:hypothetical protein